MLSYLAELVTRHELLVVFVWRDIKIKYYEYVMLFLL
jgi:hypothetical protein